MTAKDANMSETLFLIDGTALAYRSYFAMINSNLRNAEGIPTGAIYGFANALVNLLEKEQPTYLAVAWDTHEPTFRHKMDENYKANRPPQPEDLQTAIPLIKEMVSYFGFNNVERDGYEADDLIGTLALQARKEKVRVYMVTPDKDFMQLVGDNIYMYKPRNRGEGFDIIDRDGVIDYFGVEPEAVIDVLALIGDTSDNIPGVPGIGKKGAAKIIGEHKTLEKAFEAAPRMKSKRAREGLTQNQQQALKSREMIVINTNVPETISWKELRWQGVQGQALLNFFIRMEFRSLARKIDSAEKGMLGTIRNNMDQGGQGVLFSDWNEDAATQQETTAYESFDKESVTYHICSTVDDVKDMVKLLKNVDVWSFDTETSSTDPGSAELLGIAFSCQPGEAWYVVASLMEPRELISILDELFSTPKILKVAHHFKFDYRVLTNFGLRIDGPLFDTMLAAYLLDAAQKLDMDTLARTYLNYDPVSIASLIGEKGKKQKSMQDLPVETVAPYACEDADVTLRLYKIFESKLKEQKLHDLATEMEFPLAKILADMERVGIKLDRDLLHSFSKDLNTDIQKVRDTVYEMAGEEFNINSTQQLGAILFDKLHLPSRKKTATGKYSTSEQVLTTLAAEYEIAEKILEYRGLSKLKSTYVDALPKLVNKKTGRIHTTFNQHVTATGRLSSTNPNMQNIPVRTERGRGIRKAFVAEQGYRILAVDYSQVELRIIASIAGDQAMIEAFREGEDIHSRTAAEIFGLDTISDVSREHRRKAKEVNFGIPYGVSSFGLAQRLGISNKEGKKIIDAYFTRFPSIQQYITDTIAFAREHGYVETLAGRRRDIPDILSKNFNIRSFAERTAVNMPIQGTAADLIKQATIMIDQELQSCNSQTRLLLQVHDELIFEMPESEQEDTPLRVRDIMENAMELKVPLKAEIGISDNWLDAH